MRKGRCGVICREAEVRSQKSECSGLGDGRTQFWKTPNEPNLKANHKESKPHIALGANPNLTPAITRLAPCCAAAGLKHAAKGRPIRTQSAKYQTNPTCEANHRNPKQASVPKRTQISSATSQRLNRSREAMDRSQTRKRLAVQLHSTEPPAALPLCQPDFIVADEFQVPGGGGRGNGA